MNWMTSAKKRISKVSKQRRDHGKRLNSFKKIIRQSTESYNAIQRLDTNPTRSSRPCIDRRMIESSGRDQPQHTKEREKRVRDPFDELDDTNSGEDDDMELRGVQNQRSSLQFQQAQTESHGLRASHHSDSEQQSPVNQSQIFRQASISDGAIDPTQLAFTWDLFDGQQPISLSTAKTLPESRKPLATARETNNHSEKPAAATITSPKIAKLRECEKDPEPVLRESSTFFDQSDEDIRWEDVA